MPLVLAIEPDLRQADILQRVIQDKVHAEIIVVDSPDAAKAAVNAQIPDVLLLSALLSPRDEDEVVAHLRGLGAHGEHLQTHTIPQLASGRGKTQRDKGLLSAFRKKKGKEVGQTGGCDPELFAEEVRSFLKRAAEMKADAVAQLQSRVDELEYRAQHETPEPTAPAPIPAETPPVAAAPPEPEPAAPSTGSAWDSPFEWRRATPPARTYEEAPSTPPVEEPTPLGAAAPLDVPVADIAPLEASPLDEGPLVEPVHYLDDTPEPVAQEESEDAAAAAPALEEVAQPVAPSEDAAPIVLIEPEPIVVPEPEPALATEAPEISIVFDEPVAEPVIEAPAPKRRRKGAARKGTAGPVRLTPLAMWARSETRTASPPPAAASADRTTADEVRDLMAGLFIPPHVAAVSYPRGCRIRRVRVPAASRTDGGNVPGPVILSKRALSERRASAR